MKRAILALMVAAGVLGGVHRGRLAKIAIGGRGILAMVPQGALASRRTA